MSDANRGEATRCLDIALDAAANRDYEKAQRFAAKSMRLYPCDEARKVSAAVKRQKNSSESSSSGAVPNGRGAAPNRSSTSNGTPGGSLHNRRQTATATGQADASASPSRPDNSTPEQKALVRRIRATKDYYDMLGVQKSAIDDELKRAYKKLALKLHPDKNQAAGSEHAFKAISSAYACLSDSNKRAAYDRYGSEDPQQVGSHGGGGGGGGFGGEGIDPNELFNMFFGGGGFGGGQGQTNPFGPRTRVYTSFGGGNPFAQQGQRRGAREGAVPASSLATILQLVPIVLLLLFTFFQSQSSPDASLAQQGDYKFPFTTGRHHVPYWVKSTGAHNANYPDGTAARARLDDSIEVQYKERLEEMCQREKVAQAQAARWNRKKAQAMKLDHCDEIYERFGYRYNTFAY